MDASIDMLNIVSSHEVILPTYFQIRLEGLRGPVDINLSPNLNFNWLREIIKNIKKTAKLDFFIFWLECTFPGLNCKSAHSKVEIILLMTCKFHEPFLPSWEVQ